jgi:hypothetical protein
LGIGSRRVFGASVDVTEADLQRVPVCKSTTAADRNAPIDRKDSLGHGRSRAICLD